MTQIQDRKRQWESES